jgi:hypothetical protein
MSRLGYTAALLVLGIASAGMARAGDDATSDSARGNAPADIGTAKIPRGSVIRSFGDLPAAGSAMGRLLASAWGGDDALSGSSSPGHLTAYGGPIDVTLAGDDGAVPREVTITSFGGDVTIRLRNDPSVEFDICIRERGRDTGRYRITSDFALAKSRALRHPATALFAECAEQYARGTVGRGVHHVRIYVEEGNVHLVRG